MVLTDFNEKFLSCKELFLTFALFLLPPVIAAPRVVGTEYNRPDFLTLIIVMGLAETALVLYLVTHIGGRRLPDYNIMPFRPRCILFGILAGLLMFVLLILAALPFIAFRASTGEMGWPTPRFRWSFTNYSLLPLMLIACLVTGYKEELYYRCYLPTEFFRHGMSAAHAVILPVLFFGAGHFYQGGMGFAVACLLGLYLTGVLRMAKNLHVPAVAHGLYNFCVLLLSGLDFESYLGG